MSLFGPSVTGLGGGGSTVPAATQTAIDQVAAKASQDAAAADAHAAAAAASATQADTHAGVAQTAANAAAQAVTDAVTALRGGADTSHDTLGKLATIIASLAVANVAGLGDALAALAPLASPHLTGMPTAPTAAQGVNTGQVATTAFVQSAIQALIGIAPSTLDTLGELATQLQADEGAASALTTAVAAKASQADLTAHTGRTDNPHNTTAAQVGAYTQAQTDAKDAAALTAAKGYSDAQDATSLVTAKNYADTQDVALLAAAKQDASTKDASTLASAKSYADTQDGTNLTSAKTYADNGDATTLAAAKAYANTAVGAYVPPGLSLLKTEYFTSTSLVSNSAGWTRDARAKWVVILVVGGGGSGGCVQSSAQGYGGGEPGSLEIWSGWASDLPANADVTVGAGGAVPSAYNVSNDGSSSLFGNLLRANGGRGGHNGSRLTATGMARQLPLCTLRLGCPGLEGAYAAEDTTLGPGAGGGVSIYGSPGGGGAASSARPASRTAGGVVPGSNPGPGANANANDPWSFGAGGAGGYGSGTPYVAGGAGGAPGGGGGGGYSGANPSIAAAPGAGARGEVRVLTYG